MFVESLSTVRTTVRPLARVNPLVYAQLALMAVALAAQVAGEGSFSSVRAQMVLKDIGSVETLSTIATDERLLAAQVSSQVNVE